MYDTLELQLREAALRAHAALHKLWTRDVGTQGYKKQDWKDLDRAIQEIIRLAERRP